MGKEVLRRPMTFSTRTILMCYFVKIATGQRLGLFVLCYLYQAILSVFTFLECIPAIRERYKEWIRISLDDKMLCTLLYHTTPPLLV
jgi:hypothetical protein